MPLPDIHSLIKNEWHPLLKKDEGVWILMKDSFEKRLTEFLHKFETGRKKDKPNLMQAHNYPGLPYGKHKQDILEWAYRQESWEIVDKLLGKKSEQLILEIGPWNGWLTNRLAERRHSVIAIDYFIDERDGLKAKKNYNNDWIAIQADICNLDFFSAKFDSIIINHCLQYFPDPISYMNKLKPLLKKGGKIIIGGLSLYKNPLGKQREVEDYRQTNLLKHGIDFFNPTKAYLDFGDKRELEVIGFRFFYYYKKMHLRNIYALFNISKPAYFYAIFYADL